MTFFALTFYAFDFIPFGLYLVDRYLFYFKKFEFCDFYFSRFWINAIDFPLFDYLRFGLLRLDFCLFLLFTSWLLVSRWLSDVDLLPLDFTCLDLLSVYFLPFDFYPRIGAGEVKGRSLRQASIKITTFLCGRPCIDLCFSATSSMFRRSFFTITLNVNLLFYRKTSPKMSSRKITIYAVPTCLFIWVGGLHADLVRNMRRAFVFIIHLQSIYLLYDSHCRRFMWTCDQ